MIRCDSHPCYVAAIVGEYHCPVLNKVFTEFTHIVAVKTTGNVFCYEVCDFLLVESYLAFLFLLSMIRIVAVSI